jgi:hypothetical protein
MALRGGISGLGANIASGQGLTLGGGMRGAYGLDTFNPIDIGKAFYDKPTKMFWDPKSTGINKLKLMQNFEGGDLWEKVTNFIGPNAENESLAKNQEAAKKVFGINKVLEWTAKGWLSWKLGDIIKKENEEAEKEAAAAAADYGKRTVFSQFPSLMQSGEIVTPPGDALTDVYAAAEGGIMDLQGGGESRGPGTGTSDSIPAMLSDGEFVMTADAVRGAGGGDRREGARRMYEAMDRLEARA